MGKRVARIQVPARIYTYGALAPMTEATRVDEQMRLAHRYRNALVELERERRARVDAALAARSPALAQVEADLVVAEAEVEAATVVVKAQQSVGRAKTAITPMAQAVVRAAKAKRAVLYDSRKTLRTALFATRAWKKGPQKKIDAWAKAEQKQRRKANGCYWGTYLLVEKAMEKCRRGAPPRFLPWRGDGRVGAQLQRGLSVADAFGGTDTRLRIVPVPATAWLPGGRSQRRTTVDIRVGSVKPAKGKSQPIFARFPLVLHRPLPPDARIKDVVVHRRRVATHYEWRVSFTLTRVAGWAKADRAMEGTVGVDIGWRIRPDGSLRVAYWMGTDGGEGEVALPAACVAGQQKVRDLRSIRDEHFNVARIMLVAWMKGRNVPTWLREKTPLLSAWRSTARLAGLLIRWRTQRFADDMFPLADAAALRTKMSLDPGRYGAPTGIYDLLEAWRRQDKHLYDWERFQELRFQRRREDLYRNVAAQLRRRYRMAVIEKMDLRDFHELPPAEEPPVDEQAEKRCREHTRDAACSILLRCLKESMRETVTTAAAQTTMRCADCGHVEDFDRLPLAHTCGACGVTEDQDRRAARNLLDRAASGNVAPA